jgi:hypothetical protein
MERKIVARYQVVGPVMEEVEVNKCSIVKDEAGTGRVHMEPVVMSLECFHVHFPKGHSIRVTSRQRLKELGFDKRPRLIDAETGDVIETGGDPYEFVHEAPKSGGKSRVASANADGIIKE